MSAAVARMGRHNNVHDSQLAPRGGGQQQPQATSEQLRLARIIQDSKAEDQEKLRDDVRKVVELTNVSEQHALAALHDCDQDVQMAVTAVLDGSTVEEEWIEQKTKKTRRQAAQATSEPALEEEETQSSQQEQNSFRSKGGVGRGARGADQPPRFRGRGPLPPRINGQLGRGRPSEEQLVESVGSGKERGKGRWRSSSGRDSSERGRGAKPPNRGRRAGGSGGLGKIGTWNEPLKSSNTWDNSMAKETETWGTKADSNVWDNSMANHLSSKENWKASMEEWTGDEEWRSGGRKTLVFHARNAPQKSPSPSAAIHFSKPSSSDILQNNDTGPSAHYNSSGDNIDVKTLLAGTSPATDSVSFGSVGTSGSSWTQQATNTLKNELGIGKASVSSLPILSSHTDRQTAKVEMPFDVGTSSMDIQFGFGDVDGGSFEFSRSHGSASGLYRTSKLENGTGGATGIRGLSGQKENAPSAGTSSAVESTPVPSLPSSLSTLPPQKPPSGYGSLGGGQGAPSQSGPGRPLTGSSFSIPSDTSGANSDHLKTEGLMSQSSMGASQISQTGSAAMFGFGGSLATSSSAGRSVTTLAKPSMTANLYNQTALAYGGMGAGGMGMPYMNMYSPVANVRPEEALPHLMHQAAAGLFFNPMDLSALNQVPPLNYPTHSSVASASRDSASFTHAAMGSGGTDGKMGRNEPPAPPPGFTTASPSNIQAAAQLLGQPQPYGPFPTMFPGVHQATYPAVAQLMMNPSNNPSNQFPQKSAQPNFYAPSGLDGDVNNTPDFSKQFGGGNSQGVAKQLLSGGVGPNEAKSYGPNKGFPTGATGTPPPLGGLPPGFPPNFQHSPAMPAYTVGGSQHYLLSPMMAPSGGAILGDQRNASGQGAKVGGVKSYSGNFWPN